MAGATAVVVTAVMMELEVVRVEENDRSLFAHMAGAVVLVAATVKVAVTEMVTAEEKAEEKGTAAVKVAVTVKVTEVVVALDAAVMEPEADLEMEVVKVGVDLVTEVVGLVVDSERAGLEGGLVLKVAGLVATAQVLTIHLCRYQSRR